jgi:F-type H+-transporting ATPase subunit a
MEETITFITRFVNHLLGPAAAALLSWLHIKPENPELPVPQHVVMGILVLIIGAFLAFYLRSRLSVDRPGPLQQIAEALVTNPLGFGIKDLLEENSGHDAARYVPFVGSISIFILLSNLLGAFPNTFLFPPTEAVTVPLGCALLTFFYFNYQGVRTHGVLGYLGHFAGPVPALSWLILPVEIISATARILSLTVRLWANIFASDLLIAIFLTLFSGVSVWGWERSPVLGVGLGVFAATIPILFVLLHIFVSIVQSYVFTILPSVYLGLATAEEH